MGNFAQRIGQKVKSGVKFGVKVGAVGGAVALGYLGAKGASDKVSRGVEDTQFLAQQTAQGIQDITSNINVAGLIGGDTQQEAQQQVENIARNQAIAVDRLNNPDLPSLQTQANSQQQQQALIQNRARGGGQGSLVKAGCVALCNSKYGGKGRKYKRCLSDCD